jgi:hypothetical protein
MVTGFAGLASLLSDRSAELGIAAARAASAPKATRSLPPVAPPSASSSAPVVAVPGHGHSTSSWFARLFFAGIAVVIIWGLINDNKTSSTRSSYSPSSSSSSDTWTPAPNYTERIPTQGQGMTLDEPEIRYCLSQKIRIEGARNLISGGSEYEVDRFNALIDHYNSRCSNFRYRQSVMDRVRPEVENRRWKLYLEGQTLIR